MAVKTMKKNTGNGQFNAGWHELTIETANDGVWTDGQGVEKRIIDLTFKDYPEGMGHRVFATHNKTTNEEFNIANLFRYTCAGIISVLNDPTGKNPVIQYDDEVENLIGTRVNALFIKKHNPTTDKDYVEIYDLVPVVQKTEHLTYTEDDVSHLKAKVERRQSAKTTVSTNGVNTVTPDTTTADIPF